MWPFVFVSGVVKTAAVTLLPTVLHLSSKKPPDLSTAVSAFAVAAGIIWYAKKVNRPMRQRELVLFASGMVLVDVILSMLVIALPILWAGEEISVRTIDIVTGGDGKTSPFADVFVVSVGSIFVELF